MRRLGLANWLFWCATASVAPGCGGDSGAERFPIDGRAGTAGRGGAGDDVVGAGVGCLAGADRGATVGGTRAAMTGVEGLDAGSGGVARGWNGSGRPSAGHGEAGSAAAGQGGAGNSESTGQGNASDGGVGCGGTAAAAQGNAGSVAVAAGAGGSRACEEVSFSASTPDATAWQNDISQRIASSPDCRSSADVACAVAPRALDQGRPWCASVGRRILHIDEFGYGKLERDHGRILAYLNLDSSLGFVEWNPSVSMQQGRFVLEQEIGQVAFPLDGLKAALGTLSEKNPLLPSQTAHGDGILQAAHRLAPHAQSVLATFPDIDCDPEVARVALRRQVAALTGAIVRHQIRYILMSGGVTRRYFEHCPGDPDQLLRQQLDEFYAPLAAIPETIFIQSAVDKSETERELSLNDSEFLVDCTRIPGRIRVSYAAIPKRDVPVEGLPYDAFQAALSQGSRNTAACVDLFVAFFDQDPDFLGTSFVPPYVAAMAIAAENAEPDRLTAAGPERSKRLIGDGAPRLFEPRSNHQYESP